MKLNKLGKNTSAAEVLGISPLGLWLLVQDKEFFLPYQDYPWFRNATVSNIYHVELLHENHLYWPDLDIDLEVQALENPEKYSLKYKN